MSDKSDEKYIGEILQEMNSGKSIKALLFEKTWKQRAKLLLHLKTIKKCYHMFQEETAAPID